MRDPRPATLLLVLAAGAAFAQPAPDLRRSELAGPPSDRVVQRDIDGDGKPDMVERWWNGKRVRWLDENGDLRPSDTRGDQVADVLQVDMDGDSTYDGVNDQNVKWADNDGDGRADVQAWSTQPPVWGEGGKWSTAESHWMLFLDVEKDGVLGWQDWRKFDFGESNWAHDEPANWKPDYHGDGLFLKIHRPPQALPDPRLNWENPFAFYDTDGDGLTEMAMRWLDPMTPVDKGLSPLSGVLNEAFLTFDLDNDSGKGNEIDYDMTLRGTGGPGVPYRSMAQSYPALRGNPKFDRCFQWGNWRQVDQLFFMPHDKSYDAFFGAGWKTTYFVYDEDDDDHRWERVEMYYPMHGFGGPEEIDPWTTKRWRNGNYAQLEMADEGQKPGLGGHPQADSLGDRGEFDRDNSGGGQLYVGVFDRKLHLAGAEWGAWTVDRRAEFHGGWKAPGTRPSAPRWKRSSATTTRTATASSTPSPTTTTATALSTSPSRSSTTRRPPTRTLTSSRSSTPTARGGPGSTPPSTAWPAPPGSRRSTSTTRPGGAASPPPRSTCSPSRRRSASGTPTATGSRKASSA